MNFTDTLKSAELVLAAGEVPLIVGESGIGKTALAKEMAERNGWSLIVIDGNLLKEGEIGGLPAIETYSAINDEGVMVEKKTTVYAVHTKLREIDERIAEGKIVLLFIDEINRCEHTVHADGVLTWQPNATDTSFVGVGRLEIRVTYGDVVGKSARILTIVEDALVDGIAEPPEPPAQEWLNKVLSALAELDIDEINNLLNLTYNLLNNNYDLLNTTHNLVEDTRENLYRRTGILLNHLHPIETASAPDMISRRAAITFNNIANGNNVVIGMITYTFVTALGSPAANNVQVLIQDTLRNTVKTLARAIRGIDDEMNIAYGTGTDPNPICTAYWTSQRFSIGSTTVEAGESLFLLERAENVTSAIPLSSTATAIISDFTRSAYSRYILSGNVSGSGGANSVRGPLHTILPINSVVIGGQGGELYTTAYDCHLITLCRQSDTSEKELDLYISNDEETFTRIQRSTPVGSNTSAESLHIHIQMRQARVPAGYGLYICMGSDGTSSNAYCDLKFTYHLYPVHLTPEPND